MHGAQHHRPRNNTAHDSMSLLSVFMGQKCRIAEKNVVIPQKKKLTN